MILKSLELVGFKSFGEATRLDFTQGFTAIVGPNGCGKSNVSDAIRWVIGEQNSRTLRGTKLTDLIFNGSQTRKPLNRAEITLVIGNLPEGLCVANVPHVGEEMQVTRCYHRSGESEYYINQVPCRLKDIVDLFLDLGINSKSMTIIEQNHIQEIITSKPEERRNVIEEAAGILKFKHRQHEAKLKLASAEQNLLRITDIVEELGRQAESLKRQAAKGDRYKRYQAEIKNLQLNLWAKKLRAMNTEFEKTEAAFNLLTEQKSRLCAKNSDFEIRIEQLKIEIEETETDLNQKRTRIQELATEISKNEHAIELRRSQIQASQGDNAAADKEILEMRNEIESLNREIETQREKLSNASEDIDQREATHRQQTEALIASKGHLREREDTARSVEETLKTLYHQTAQMKNEITALETRKKFLQTRGEKLLHEESETAGALGAAQKRARELETQYRIKVGAFEKVKAEHNAVMEKLTGCKAELKKQDQRVNAANETYLARRSLLESMRELRSKFEGFQDGVKALMSTTNGNRLPGLREVLVDVIQTVTEYEPALEAALGNHLQSVIVNSYNDTVQAIDYLKSHQSGRSSFIPVHPKTLPQPPINLNGNPAVLGKMIDKVQCPEEYRPLLDHLIGNVVVVQDLETALNVHTKPEFQGVVVTQNGEAIDSNGIVSGGQVSDTSSGLLSQKREIEELEDKVNTLSQELDAASRKQDHLGTDLNRMETRLSALQPAWREAEVVQADRRRDLEEGHREIERFQQKLSNLNFDRSSGNLEFQELSEEATHLTGKLNPLESEKKVNEERQSTLRQELETFKTEIENQAQGTHDLEVWIAALKGKREILLSEIKRVHLQQENLNQRIEKRLQDQQTNVGKIIVHGSTIESNEQTILQSVGKKNILNEEAVGLEENLTEKEDTLKEVEQESRAVFKNYQDTVERLSKVEVKRSETKIQTSHLQEQAYNDYGLTRGELLAQYTEDIDEAEVSETVRTLREKVARMGDVNLAALSEYQQTQERYTFLHRQQADLGESIKTLKQAIEKINQTIQERFLTTFHQVNEQFQSMYARLFEGGQASLVMLDEANPLESGVDIHAQPLGKKMQNLSLLSGGEKAMTGISLIFSLLKVRPSPFCLLDEVDAPLDEPNVVRFKTILQEMAENTQFILITHNQKTMSFADVLYGVTMEERGVSKAVSVHLN